MQCLVVSTVQECINEAMSVTPCILLLRHFGALFKTDVAMQHTQESQESRISIALQHALDGALKKQQSEQPLPLLLVATVESLDSLSGRVRSACFYRELESKAPDQELRAEILEALCDGQHLAFDVSLEDLAARTASFVRRVHWFFRSIMSSNLIGVVWQVFGDLDSLVCRAGLNALARVRERSAGGLSEATMIALGVVISGDDFEKALDHMHHLQAENLGTPKVLLLLVARLAMRLDDDLV